MNTLNRFTVLVRTYFSAVAINLLVLFCVVFAFFTSYYGFFDYASGVFLAFLFPGIACVLIFLPILLKDKNIAGLDKIQLIKRYLPPVILFIVTVLALLLLSGIYSIWNYSGIYSIWNHFWLYFYCENILCLYLFCRAITKEKT